MGGAMSTRCRVRELRPRRSGSAAGGERARGWDTPNERTDLEEASLPEPLHVVPVLDQPVAYGVGDVVRGRARERLVPDVKVHILKPLAEALGALGWRGGAARWTVREEEERECEGRRACGAAARGPPRPPRPPRPPHATNGDAPPSPTAPPRWE